MSAASESGIFAPGSTAIGDALAAPLLGILHAGGFKDAAVEPTDPMGKAEFEGIFGSGSWDDPVVHADLAMALHGTPTAYGKVDKGMLGDYMDTRHYDTFAVGTEGADPSGTTPSTTTKSTSTAPETPSVSLSSGTYTPFVPGKYPYLIPSRFDFSGPAGMPYTRAYWEDAGLPMGLLSYEYPGTYGSGTGGILGPGGSVYRPPVDTGGVFGTRTGTGSTETGTSPTDSELRTIFTPETLPPETDFERHYPDDRGHDVHRTSPIYDDRDSRDLYAKSTGWTDEWGGSPMVDSRGRTEEEWIMDAPEDIYERDILAPLWDEGFIEDAKKSADRTSVLLSPYWDDLGDGPYTTSLVGHLGETVPDYTGYSDAVSAGLAEPRRLDGPPLPPSTVSRSEPAPLTADAERMAEADRVARASEAERKSEMDRRAEEDEAYKRLMAIVEAEERAKDADMKAKAADAALRAEADRRAAEAAERRAKAAEEERKKRVEALSFHPGRPVPPSMTPTTAGHTTAWEGGRHGGSVTRDASGAVVSSFSSDFASDDFMAGTGPPSVSAGEGWSPGEGWGGDAGGR